MLKAFSLVNIRLIRSFDMHPTTIALFVVEVLERVKNFLHLPCWPKVANAFNPQNSLNMHRFQD